MNVTFGLLEWKDKEAEEMWMQRKAAEFGDLETLKRLHEETGKLSSFAYRAGAEAGHVNVCEYCWSLDKNDNDARDAMEYGAHHGRANVVRWAYGKIGCKFSLDDIMFVAARGDDGKEQIKIVKMLKKWGATRSDHLLAIAEYKKNENLIDFAECWLREEK